jgi:hypothetical protein
LHDGAALQAALNRDRLPIGAGGGRHLVERYASGGLVCHRLRRGAVGVDDGHVRLDEIDHAVAIDISRKGLRLAVRRGRQNALAADSAVGIEFLVIDGRRAVRIMRRCGVQRMARCLVNETHRRRRSCRPVGAREGRLAVNARTIGEGAADLVLDQIDRSDARLRQRLQSLRAVRIAHDQFELRELRIAGVEHAVVVRVEHIAQRLHVGSRRRVPLREDDLVLLVDHAVVVGVIGQHRVARRRPGGAMLVAVARHIEKGVGGRHRIDFDAVAVEIEHDRKQMSEKTADRVEDVAEKRADASDKRGEIAPHARNERAQLREIIEAEAAFRPAAISERVETIGRQRLIAEVDAELESLAGETGVIIGRGLQAARAGRGVAVGDLIVIREPVVFDPRV